MPFRRAPGCGCCDCPSCSAADATLDLEVPAPDNDNCTDCAGIAGTYTLDYLGRFVPGGDQCYHRGDYSPTTGDCDDPFSAEVIWTQGAGFSPAKIEILLAFGNGVGVNDEFHVATIDSEDHTLDSVLASPIDCTKSYVLTLDSDVDLLTGVFGSTVSCVFKSGSEFLIN